MYPTTLQDVYAATALKRRRERGSDVSQHHQGHYVARCEQILNRYKQDNRGLLIRPYVNRYVNFTPVKGVPSLTL